MWGRAQGNLTASRAGPGRRATTWPTSIRPTTPRTRWTSCWAAWRRHARPERRGGRGPGEGPQAAGGRRQAAGGVERGGPAGRGGSSAGRRGLVPHRREEHDLADAVPPAQDHHQAVDSDADPAGGRHAVLQRLDVVLVVGLGLLVAGGLIRTLLLEGGALLMGVVQLGERVRNPHARGESPEALNEAGLGAVVLRER